MVAITGAHGTDVVIRRAARIAARTKADLHAVHVVGSEQSRRGASTRPSRCCTSWLMTWEPSGTC